MNLDGSHFHFFVQHIYLTSLQYSVATPARGLDSTDQISLTRPLWKCGCNIQSTCAS